MSDQPTGEPTSAETPAKTVAEIPVETAPVEAAPIEAATIETTAKPSDWMGKLVLWLGIASPTAALVGALGAAWGIWEFGRGFLGLAAALVLAVLAVAIGAGVGARNRKRSISSPKFRRWVGMALGMGMIGWLGSLGIAAFSVPAIHDVATDLADPPQFRMLAVRSDNLDAVPGADDPDMRGMGPQQRWAAIHAKAYGDIRSVRIAMPVADTIAKAERIAKERGWDIAIADPVEGRLEATDTTRFFRFKDDIVLRVRPNDDGTASIIDMRSISRVGMSDLGVNAKRVRAFLADMAGTNPAG